MFEYYYAALFSRALKGDLAHSALPDAPVRPDRRDRRSQQPSPSPAGSGQAKAPDDPPPIAAESSDWDPCPCRQWGVCRADRHGCAALCRELFPELDQELDAWEAAHGWLYR
jgi:hypothetical protein